MLTKAEREELTFLSYYDQHARGSAKLSDAEAARLKELRAKAEKEVAATAEP